MQWKKLKKMSRQSHKVERTCLGCMGRDAQDAMVRLAAAADGRVSVDCRRRLGGRGGYLHRGRECLDRFTRGKARQFRSLRMALDRDERQLIARMLQERLDSSGALE